MLNHRGQHDQGEGAVQGGHQSAEVRTGEHGEIHGGECDTAHQVGDEDHLLGKVAVPLATAAGADVAQELAADSGEDGGDEGQADGIPEGAEEIGIPEDAHVVGVLINLTFFADPVVKRQVIQTVAGAGGDLEGLHDQHEEGHHHGQEQEDHQEHHEGLLGLAQLHQRGAAALAADGGVGLPDAHDPLVGEDDEGGQQHQYDGHGIADSLGTLVDEGTHLGSQSVVADAVTQVGGDAVCTDGFADGHNGGGQHRGQDQGQSDVPQDLRFAGALDLAHLLQLGVDGAERAGDHDVGECVIVHGHAQHDGDGAVSQPVGNGNAQTGQEAVGAGGGVAEHGQPGQSLGPGGDHIRYGHQQA